MKKLLYIFCLLPIFLLTACPVPPAESPFVETATLITHVNIINVRDGSIQEDMTVVVDGGRIVEILESIEEHDNGTEVIIEASGLYLLPGLTEMHAHIPSSDWGREDVEETLFLYLSNGITTIRGMLGHPQHLELRQKAADHELLSPRIFTGSPSLNGETAQSRNEARRKVMDYHAQGYDFLKLHPGLASEVFEEIVASAAQVGIPIAGHVSASVGIWRALESGYASIDHVDGFLEGLVPADAGIDPAAGGFFGYEFTHLADTAKIDELVQATHRNRVWVVPTQSLFERWFSPRDAEALAREPEMKYMPASMVEEWIERKKALTDDAAFDQDKWEDFNRIRRKLIYELHQQGQGLLLGSDAPQVFNVPGFSIHHELDAMLQAGLSPLEAIQTGTLNPALFFGREGEFGEVVEGSVADLILLSSNPLEDIEALKNPEGVMRQGRFLSKKDIDARLQQIADRAAEQ